MLGPVALLTACAVVWWPETSLDDLRFLPSHDFIAVSLEANCSYRKYLCDRYPLSPAEGEWREFQERQAAFSSLCWYQLYYARQNWQMPQKNWFDEETRLEHLERLRELLGDEAYFAGRMPAPVPTWR